MHLGASAYFTKPYIEQEFLVALKATMTQDTPVGVPALPTHHNHYLSTREAKFP
jgi:DNA-binding response OmpR family regulator